MLAFVYDDGRIGGKLSIAREWKGTMWWTQVRRDRCSHSETCVRSTMVSVGEGGVQAKEFQTHNKI